MHDKLFVGFQLVMHNVTAILFVTNQVLDLQLDKLILFFSKNFDVSIGWKHCNIMKHYGKLYAYFIAGYLVYFSRLVYIQCQPCMFLF